VRTLGVLPSNVRRTAYQSGSPLRNLRDGRAAAARGGLYAAPRLACGNHAADAVMRYVLGAPLVEAVFAFTIPCASIS
jgi:hypothetical protein